ncbi:hypothetical protein CRE_05807 [Caenorhabditis remanei]|uniref:Uncharacterized protein n=1 Tax=Caenorhabditis remanei TaxID=31234 RepID=E3M079_CAERE|nr:hypothetical protein CRE_05807 [Caenorhabditis remanei]
MIRVIITEDMVLCFHQSAKLKEYYMFFEEYQNLLGCLIHNLKIGSFPKEYVCNFVSMHLKLCFDFLVKWNPKAPFLFQGTTFLEKYVPELLHDMKHSISIGLQTRDSTYNFKKPPSDFLELSFCRANGSAKTSEILSKKSPETAKQDKSACQEKMFHKINESTRTAACAEFQRVQVSTPVISFSRPQKKISISPTLTPISVISMGFSGIERMATTGDIGSCELDRRQTTISIRMRKQIVRRLFQKELAEQKKFYERKIADLLNYQDKLNELKEIFMKICGNSHDNTEKQRVENLQEVVKSIEKNVIAKRLELFEELISRQTYLSWQMEEVLKLFGSESNHDSISKQKEVNQNLTSVMGSGSEQSIQDNKLTVLEDLRRKYLECMEKQTETNEAYEKQLEIIKRQQDSMNERTDRELTKILKQFQEASILRPPSSYFLKMTVELEISEDMIKCFYYCNDSDRLCKILSQNCISLLEFLPKYPENVPRRSSRKITESLEKYIPEFCEDLKQAISSKNWDDFYWKYRSTADKIILEGRKQGWIQVVIEHRNFYDSVNIPSLYESFEARDSAANYRHDTKVLTLENKESKGPAPFAHEKVSTQKLTAIKSSSTISHYPDSLESIENLKKEILSQKINFEQRLVNFEILQNDMKEKLEEEIEQTESKLQKSIISKLKRNEEPLKILKEEMRIELNALRQSIEQTLSESQTEIRKFVKKEIQSLETKLNVKIETKMEEGFKKQEELWKTETVNMITAMLDKTGISQEPFESKTDQLEETTKSEKIPEEQEARLYELSNFLGSVLRTHIALENEFKRLKVLEEEYHNYLIPKVLRKCLADVANQLLEIVEAIENLETDRDGFENLEEQMENLKPSSIYSIRKLRIVCQNGHLPESYDYVHFPQMKRFVLFISFSYNLKHIFSSPESCISDVETIISLDDESEEEYRKMHEEFQRKIDEQNREYEREVKLAQQQRSDMNKKAEEELRRHGEKFKQSTSARRRFN